MKKISFLSIIITALYSIIVFCEASAATDISVGDQLVEHRVAPVGIDAKQPRFSWQLHGSANGLRQTAYHVEVTSGAMDKSVVWDSGWVVSDQSILVAYAGKPLVSSTPYFWRVQVKDEKGVESPWSESARWVTGLLAAEKELRADWIGLDQPSPVTPHGEDWFDIGKADWIYHPDIQPDRQKKGESVVVFYRTKFNMPEDARRVMIGMAANTMGQFFLNGVELFQGGKFAIPRYLDVTPWVKKGVNQLAFRINEADPRGQPGLIAAVRMEQTGGKVARYFTNATWETTLQPVNLWSGGEKPGDAWKPVKVLGKPGEPNKGGEGKEAKLVSPEFGGQTFMPPPVRLRKEIDLRKPVRFAVFHGTAQGLYDLHINGTQMTPTGFQPGWTQFEKHISYVSTDVTAALTSGPNAIGVVLADGWFRGNVLWVGRQNFSKVFGDKIRFSGQLEVEYTDGSRESFRTDPTWKAAYGPTLQADIYNGEIYDARLEQSGWDKPKFVEKNWIPVVDEPRPAKEDFVQRSHPTEPVRVELELNPKAITEPEPKVYVVDFGQNFAGWTRLKINGKAGQAIYLRFGEDLKPDGTIYTDNLRSVNPADLYICKGGGLETWEPRFTYHGFRYVQIVGLTDKPTPETLTGMVAHSAGPITSNFDSSSSMLNRIYKNIQWSQRSNYFETMTDCPQRDERYGWAGDAHFFMASSAYNQNAASFFTKWFYDCADTQKPSTGNISNGVPGYRPGGGSASLDWSAAMMITPWMIWQRYGDPQPIKDHYADLQLYMTQWEKMAADPEAKGKDGKTDYRIIGDWLSLEKGTSKEFCGHFYGYLMSMHMVDCARIAGHEDDVRKFTELASKYRADLIQKDITADGTVDGGSETAYALITRYHLYEPAQEKLIRDKFQKRMAANQYTVQTGFLGTGNLLQGLSTIGLNDAASKTILNEKVPSWGGMIKMGATTIWERWNGKNPDGTFFNPSMNSFNHYTFGGCGEWMMGYLVGLRLENPGFKVVHVEPAIIPGLNMASASFESPYGRVSNRWERQDGRITMHLVIPPNSTALVTIPATAKNAALAGKPILPKTGGLEVASGTHDFTWTE